MLLSLAQGDGRRSLHAVLGKRVRAYTKAEEKSLGGGQNKKVQMIRLDRSACLDHRLRNQMFAVLFRQLVGTTSVEYAALQPFAETIINAGYSIKAPCLRKISSWVILSGIPCGFKTAFPQRIRIS